MRRTKSTIYSVKYWYSIGSEGFHTSIIYGAAGLMYGRYRGLGDILRNYSPSEITRRSCEKTERLTSVHLPTPAK